MSRRVSSVATLMFALVISASVACPGRLADAAEAERVTFATDDGVTIVGDLVRGSKKAPAVVLLHMYRSNREAWKPLMPELSQAGYTVLAIDLRGHGESTDQKGRKISWEGQAKTKPNIFTDMHRDVAASIQYLAKTSGTKPSSYSLVGASVGCSVALDAASRLKQIKAAVLLSPGTDYLGVDSLSHIAKYGKRPLLMISDDKEAAKVGQLQEKLAKSKKHTTQEYPGAGHGTRMFGKEKELATVIVDWLGKQVPAAKGKGKSGSKKGW